MAVFDVIVDIMDVTVAFLYVTVAYLVQLSFAKNTIKSLHFILSAMPW